MLRIFLRRFCWEKRGPAQRPAPRVLQGPGGLRVAPGASGRPRRAAGVSLLTRLTGQPTAPPCSQRADARRSPLLRERLVCDRLRHSVCGLPGKWRGSGGPPVAGATPTPGRRRGHPAGCCAAGVHSLRNISQTRRIPRLTSRPRPECSVPRLAAAGHFADAGCLPASSSGLWSSARSSAGILITLRS
jgi:hypothetical protein